MKANGERGFAFGLRAALGPAAALIAMAPAAAQDDFDAFARSIRSAETMCAGIRAIPFACDVDTRNRLVIVTVGEPKPGAATFSAERFCEDILRQPYEDDFTPEWRVRLRLRNGVSVATCPLVGTSP